MEIHFKIIGVLLIALSIVHTIFPTYFNWKNELPGLSLINRQMMYVHTFFIALLVFLVGLLCLTSSHDLIETGLGKKVTFGLGVFWIIRLFVQFFGYSPQLWRGKPLETAIHVLFSILWTYMSVVFMTASQTR
jgi:hypothetical protein